MVENGGPLVFFVDDNRDNLRLVRDLLGVHGIRVVCFTDARGLLERATMEKPALILMDLTLKEESGLELTLKLKRTPRTSAIPVVILSAHSTEQDKVNALASGCDGFINKPIDTRRFPSEVYKYIRRLPEKPALSEDLPGAVPTERS
jgi:CheY-like chemotaxis protein